MRRKAQRGRSLLQGWAALSGSNLTGGLLQFASLVVVGRALGAEGLGLVALVLAYLAVVDGLLNFQSVHVLTRCLAEAQASSDYGRFMGFVRAGLAIDGVTACIAATVAAFGLAVGAELIGLTAEWVPIALSAVPVILTRILGTAEAVLRCYDRFGMIGMRSVLLGGLALLGVSVGWIMGWSAGYFLAAMLVAEAIANLTLLGLAAATVRQAVPARLSDGDMRDAVGSVPGFWLMMWRTNLTFGIRFLSQDGDMLVAGAVLGPQAVGLLRAVKSITGLVNHLGRPIQQVAAAPLARLWAAEDALGFQQLSLRLSGLAGLVGLCAALLLWVLAPTVLSLSYGEEYLAATTALGLMSLARAVFLSGVTLTPTMLTLGLDMHFLRIMVMGTVAYFAVMLAMIGPLGITGVALGHLAFELVWVASGWTYVSRRLRHL